MSEPESEIVLKFDSIISADKYADIPVYDQDKIAEIISRFPYLEVQFSARIATLEQERFLIHQEYKDAKAMARTEARALAGDQRLRNETAVEDYATVHPKVKDAMNREVACVSELKRVKAQHEGWKAAFIAARKLETRIQQENQIEIQSARYIT